MWALISMLAAGVCVTGIAAALLSPARHRANKESINSDEPLPVWMRLLRPWTAAVAPLARRMLAHRTRVCIEQLLVQAGLARGLAAEGMLALQIALAWLLAVATGLSSWLMGIPAEGVAVCACLAAFLGLGYPRIWLRDQAKIRRDRIARELPFALDMTTLCIEAGLNLHGALEQAAARGPVGPLRDELSWTLAEIRTGSPRMQALRNMATRTGVLGLRTVVAALAQADTLGMSVGPLLRAQAESLRGKRFLHAERQALEAPVKMLFPLIACIFPCTFLVIGFPIMVKLMEHA